MAELGISEFTFGYAFLYEQTQRNWGNLRAHPVLPSLSEEANAGYDAHLPLVGTDYYYQFKLSDRLERRNAKHIKDATYDGAYSRLWLHKRDFNRQHRLLWELSQSHPHTFYVAPEFESFDAFSDAFLNGLTTEGSRLIPLNQCEPYNADDSRQHYITFSAGDTDFAQHSKRKTRTGSVTGASLKSLYDAGKSDAKQINTQFASQLLGDTASVLSKALASEKKRSDKTKIETQLRRLQDVSQSPLRDDRRALLSYSAQALSISFGVTMVIVGEE